jgi:hypothetical protein
MAASSEPERGVSRYHGLCANLNPADPSTGLCLRSEHALDSQTLTAYRNSMSQHTYSPRLHNTSGYCCVPGPPHLRVCHPGGRRRGQATEFGNGGIRRMTRAPNPRPPGIRRTPHQTTDGPVPTPNPSPAASRPRPGLQRHRFDPVPTPSPSARNPNPVSLRQQPATRAQMNAAADVRRSNPGPVACRRQPATRTRAQIKSGGRSNPFPRPWFIRVARQAYWILTV